MGRDFLLHKGPGTVDFGNYKIGKTGLEEIHG